MVEKLVAKAYDNVKIGLDALLSLLSYRRTVAPLRHYPVLVLDFYSSVSIAFRHLFLTSR
jgi:hypothetical protein